MTQAAPAAEVSIAKVDFARRRGVTKARVSQWIAEKKISGAAFDGEGTHARIFESIALAQLNRGLDISQRLGNGAATNLMPAAPAPIEAAAPGDNVVEIKPRPADSKAAAPPVDQVGEQIRREQLESLQRKNRLERVKESTDTGRLVDAGAVEIAAAKLARDLIVTFDGALANLAAATASKFKIPQRDALHLFRATWRDLRAKAAASAAIEAAALPETVEHEIAIDAPAVPIDQAAALDQADQVPADAGADLLEAAAP